MDSTDEILVEYGVHLGYGDNRKELAETLERNGLTGEDLRMVCDHVMDAGSAKTMGARVSSVLTNKDRWGPLLADLRRFHDIRHRNQAKKAKRKLEPGKGLRDLDKRNAELGTAAYYSLGPEELLKFKWRWLVADWMHRGHNFESLERFMDATREEVEDCLKRFPKEQPFEVALAEYVKLKEKKDASDDRPH